MERHRNIAGVLQMVWGAILVLIALLVVFGVIGGGLLSDDRTAIAVTTGVGTVVGIIILAFALLFIIAGHGFKKGRPWARPLMWVAAVLTLFSFPLGTALAIYTIWVLTKTG